MKLGDPSRPAGQSALNEKEGSKTVYIIVAETCVASFGLPLST